MDGIFKSLPSTGDLLAPGLLVKFGDHRERFPTAGEVQALAGTCPVTTWRCKQEEAGQVSSGMQPRVPSLRRVIRASLQAPIELGGGLRAGDSPPIAIRMLTPTASWRTAGSLSCGDCGRIVNRMMKPIIYTSAHSVASRQHRLT